MTFTIIGIPCVPPKLFIQEKVVRFLPQDTALATSETGHSILANGLPTDGVDRTFWDGKHRTLCYVTIRRTTTPNPAYVHNWILDSLVYAAVTGSTLSQEVITSWYGPVV
jgi:hypothetical protein